MADWDLHAVVRSCNSTTKTSLSLTSSLVPMEQFSSFPDPFQQNFSTNSKDLSEFFKPVVPKFQPLSPLSVLGEIQDLSPPLLPPPSVNKTKQSSLKVSATSKTKRRRNQMKRVCEVPAEGLSSDIWSWRKYGQKPIKGSPYPRGYYKCSSTKGCLARKQVERSRSNPGMFNVTYTGDHTHPIPLHRNSLAGVTRNVVPKPVTDDSITAPDISKSQSPISTDKMDGENEDDELSTSEMVISDDFFEGLEVLAEDCFSGNFTADF